MSGMPYLSGECGTIDGAEWCANTPRPLTHLIDSTDRQDALNTTDCSVPDCTHPARKRGWCGTHYSRWRRTGDLSLRRITPAEDRERFLSKIDRRSQNECWPWLGTILNTGYGQFVARGRKFMAHRYSYEVHVGPIPDGLTIDHVAAWGCTRLDCVNPSHLEPVTMGVNVLRGTAVSAINAAKTGCSEGHEFDATKVVKGRVERFCRACSNQKQRERLARSKA
jgi:hypothetical protein